MGQVIATYCNDPIFMCRHSIINIKSKSEIKKAQKAPGNNPNPAHHGEFFNAQRRPLECLDTPPGGAIAQFAASKATTHEAAIQTDANSSAGRLRYHCEVYRNPFGRAVRPSPNPPKRSTCNSAPAMSVYRPNHRDLPLFPMSANLLGAQLTLC